MHKKWYEAISSIFQHFCWYFIFKISSTFLSFHEIVNINLNEITYDNNILLIISTKYKENKKINYKII